MDEKIRADISDVEMVLLTRCQEHRILYKQCLIRLMRTGPDAATRLPRNLIQLLVA